MKAMSLVNAMSQRHPLAPLSFLNPLPLTKGGVNWGGGDVSWAEGKLSVGGGGGGGKLGGEGGKQNGGGGGSKLGRLTGGGGGGGVMKRNA